MWLLLGLKQAEIRCTISGLFLSDCWPFHWSYYSTNILHVIVWNTISISFCCTAHACICHSGFCSIILVSYVPHCCHTFVLSLGHAKEATILYKRGKIEPNSHPAPELEQTAGHLVDSKRKKKKKSKMFLPLSSSMTHFSLNWPFVINSLGS